MWMRISLILAALLVWDMATSDGGHSAIERGGRALMSIGPVHDFVAYVEDGSLLEDLRSVSASAMGEASLALMPVQSRKARAEEQDIDTGPENATAEVSPIVASQTKEVHLSEEDVQAIAKAVGDLYQKEEKEASEAAASSEVTAPPEPGPAPEPEKVEKAVADLGPDLLGAIVKASKETGVHAGYLLHIALRESDLTLTAQAPTSSAAGPFQFVKQTWYQMIGHYGAKHGLDTDVALLKQDGDGMFEPVSAEAREKLLALRTDPYASALMAADLTLENGRYLERELGRPAVHGELYAAHVFGPAGAVKLVRTMEKTPAASAASILPSAAAANRWLFYTRGGTPRSVATLFDEVSRFMTTREVARMCTADLNFLGL